MKKTTNSVNKWKKKITALYKKYRGQFFNWCQKKVIGLDEQKKSFQKQFNVWKKKAKQQSGFYSSKLATLAEKILKKEQLPESQPEDLLNRRVYAQKIADVVEKRYDEGVQEHRDEKNIIFAISGKWGSGKTRILELLKPLLVDKGFKVVWFNTWNYSQEPISLKRAFLKALAKDLDSGIDLTGLEQDSTELKFSVKRLVCFLCFLISLFFLVTVLLFIKDNVFASSLISYFIAYLSYIGGAFNTVVFSEITKLLVIPITLFLLTEVFTLKQTTSKITTAEEFRSKFDDIVENETNVVVFVDDLDRCTPEVVKQILDALVTFFKNDHCSFVVTGDHTVIEKYVGKKLQITPFYDEKGQEDKKRTGLLEILEGRRFLKKLFDVYWQIPSPEPVRFREFLGHEVKKANIQNLDDSKEKQLIVLLDKFLERNPRAVVRFLTALSFNLDTISYMISEKEKETQGNSEVTKEQSKIELQGLKEVLEQPVLLAKVLLIQELFYLLYEMLVLHPEIISTHEKEARKTGQLSSVGGKDLNELLVTGEEQRQYLELLKLTPKFTNDETDEVVFNADNFFYLSGFTGLPSQKGPDEDRFLQLLKTSTSSEELIKSLRGASENKQKQFLSLSEKAFGSATDANEKQNITINTVEIMVQVPSWFSGFDGVITKLTENNFVHGLDPSIRSRIATAVFKFSFVNDHDVDNFFTGSPWNDSIYSPIKWEVVNQVSQNLHSDVVAKFIPIVEGELNTQDDNNALTHLKTLFMKVNQDDNNTLQQIKPLFEKVINTAFTRPLDGTRLPFFQVLADVDRKRVVKDNLISSQTNILQDSNFITETQFFLNNQHILQSYLNEGELQKLRIVPIDLLRSKQSLDWPQLADILIAFLSWNNSEKEKVIDVIIHHLTDTDPQNFATAVAYIQKPELRQLIGAPKLFPKLVSVLNSLSDANKVSILDYLNKAKWVELNLPLTQPEANILGELVKSQNSNVSQKARDELESWGIKIRGRKRQK